MKAKMDIRLIKSKDPIKENDKSPHVRPVRDHCGKGCPDGSTGGLSRYNLYNTVYIGS